jgi:hypothetical protein
MNCPSCASSNRAEFPSEIALHFHGLINWGKPHVFIFSTVLVCLECGFLQSEVPEKQLRELRNEIASSKAA